MVGNVVAVKRNQEFERETKTGEVESSCTCVGFEVSGFDVYRFAFFSYFFQKLDILRRISAFESPHLDEYKNNYDF